MLYIPHQSTDVYFNFGLEYYLLSEMRFTEPVFLLWRTTPTLMIGKYQNALSEVNVDYVNKHQLELVRRKSGGGTIYTDLGGFQYSFIQPQNKNRIEFSEFVKPIIAGLDSLGVEAIFSGRNDLLVEGKKISGTAQYKELGYVVHHGSLLYDTDLEALTQSTQVELEKIESKGIKSVRDRVTNISQHMNSRMLPSEFQDYLVRFVLNYSEGEPVLDSKINPQNIYNLTATDVEKIETIADRDFRSTKAFWYRDPSFNLNLKQRFDGGMIQLDLAVKQGLIEKVRVFGDFFGTLETAEVEKVLQGSSLKSKEILLRLKSLSLRSKLYRITAEDIAGMFNRLEV